MNLSTNPKGVVDAQSGLKAAKFTNAPGENYIVNRRPHVPAIEFVAPPPLGEDVYKLLEILKAEFDDIGFMRGAQDPGNAGESGEKLKEARFNTDRFLGPTMRRAAGEYGRMYETWQAIFPTIWDLEATLDYVGDDNVGRTIVVFPLLFKEGKVHVRPDVESMLPEGRGEKQEKVFMMYQQGLFGLPGSPEALRKFWEMAHMPHLARAGKPGGIDGVTAERENGKLLQGANPLEIPVFEWYDDAAHLFVHERVMKSPEFTDDFPKEIQDAFAIHRSAHLFNMQQKAMKMAQMQALTNPQPTPGEPGAGGAPGGRGGGPKGGPSNRPNDNETAGGEAPAARPSLPEPPKGIQQRALPTVAH